MSSDKDKGKEQPPDQSGEQPAPRTRTGEILREATGVGRWLSGLSPTQVQALALVWLTLFVCTLAGFIVYKWDAAREADKEREERRIDSMVRESNAREELAAQRYTTILRETRDAFLRHDSDQRMKDRMADKERSLEQSKVLREIQNAWAAFAIKIADLERFLRGKKTHPEDASAWPWPGDLCPDPMPQAPMPRAKTSEP